MSARKKVIQAGKFADLTLEQAAIKALEDYVQYFEKKAEEKKEKVWAPILALKGDLQQWRAEVDAELGAGTGIDEIPF